jgi:hypothetical protein
MFFLYECVCLNIYVCVLEYLRVYVFVDFLSIYACVFYEYLRKRTCVCVCVCVCVCSCLRVLTYSLSPCTPTVHDFGLGVSSAVEINTNVAAIWSPESAALLPKHSPRAAESSLSAHKEYHSRVPINHPSNRKTCGKIEKEKKIVIAFGAIQCIPLDTFTCFTFDLVFHFTINVRFKSRMK